MCDPWSHLHSVQGEDGVELMNVDVVEGDRVGLCSSSAHAPDLVAALVIVPMLVVSGVRHRHRIVCVSEGVVWEVFEVFEVEFLCILKPATDLAFESPVEDFKGCIIVKVLSDPFKALGDVTDRSVFVFIVSSAFCSVESSYTDLIERVSINVCCPCLGESCGVALQL